MILIGFVGTSEAFSTSSCLRVVCASSLQDESPGVHPGVCFVRSCFRFDVLFGVVSGRPPFFGLMASTGGTNNVSHCANSVHACFPSTRDAMTDRKQSAMIAVQSTLRHSYTAMTKPALYFGITGGRECTNTYSKRIRTTSRNRGSSPPSVLYALLPREYSPKYSVNISMEGFSMDRRPLAWIVPSVISSRSIVGATFSGSSCGGALAISRNPSRQFLLNHSHVVVESSMEPVSSSSLSVCLTGRVFFSVCLSAFVVFCALPNLSSQKENPSFGF